MPTVARTLDEVLAVRIEWCLAHDDRLATGDLQRDIGLRECQVEIERGVVRRAAG